MHIDTNADALSGVPLRKVNANPLVNAACKKYVDRTVKSLLGSSGYGFGMTRVRMWTMCAV
jgi:hypothetical protein